MCHYLDYLWKRYEKLDKNYKNQNSSNFNPFHKKNLLIFSKEKTTQKFEFSKFSKLVT